MSSNITDHEALAFHHKDGVPGKVSLSPTKPLSTQHHLSLAYSPGVAVPCIKIKEDELSVYKYTAKGNYVAVISNGTAVLGLGNLGALASKPVMEGKAVLFKRFADIDAIDIEIDTENVDEFVNSVKYLGASWGGINLEDIKSPDCFLIEKKLQEIMDIPVFHDDQHGTAIIVGAGLINAVRLTKRRMENLKVVVNGTGAAGIACIDFIKIMGVKDITACDQYGIIYKDRKEGMNPWKEKYAIDTEKRSLSEALENADVFLGLSVKDVLKPEMLESMNASPIIFAMANPDPEIKPEIAKKVRPDAIIATGRSDYSNQINNVMGFPYIFRGALDVRATKINDEMKLAAAQAIADLASEPVADEVSTAYAGRKMQYGPDYIVPTPFDPRLITRIPPAVAKAAMETGVARQDINDWPGYIKTLKGRMSPTAHIFEIFHSRMLNHTRTVIFSEGEEEQVIKAAIEWRDSGYGLPVLIGRKNKIENKMDEMGLTDRSGIKIDNAALSDRNGVYIDYMYKKLQRSGFLHRSCVRAVKTDRNIFAACMLACGDGDILVTGVTRNYHTALKEVSQIINHSNNLFAISMVMIDNKPVLLGDTAINEQPSGKELASMAKQMAERIRQIGEEPRVAFISSSTFTKSEQSEDVQIAIKVLKEEGVDFEYDGELEIDIALHTDSIHSYPFCKLSEAANILIMPNLSSSSIAARLLKRYGATIVDSILIGMEKPVQIAQTNASPSELYNLALLSAVESIKI